MLTRVACVFALCAAVTISACASSKREEVCVRGLGTPMLPAPTEVCDETNAGALMCSGGCSWQCAGGCWSFLCDGPCGGLDAGR